MKNQKYKAYVLFGLVIVLIISLVFISFKNREQSIYIERVMLADELQERLYDLGKLRIILEEVSFNSENMSLITRINDHRGTDFIQWVQYPRFPHYYKFLLDYDVEYYGIIHDLKGKAAAADQSNLKGVTEGLELIESQLLDSIEWEIGRDNGKHYIKLEFGQKDMDNVINGLRDIRRIIDGF
ncbi:MAG TPA: hypothetical protein VFF83_01290 [Clostridia bacterium]|nr:hypothetical protein [Clostridia bacterium]